MADPLRLNADARISPLGGQPKTPPNAVRPGAPSFTDALHQAEEVRFSNHAQKRLENRNIALSEDGLNRLATAVDKAGKRGGKESLILMDDLAFIVNVRDRLIVTALDQGSRGEGVFTQIDSVVFAEPSKTGFAPETNQPQAGPLGGSLNLSAQEA
jgi:flagellar operon protein